MFAFFLPKPGATVARIVFAQAGGVLTAKEVVYIVDGKEKTTQNYQIFHFTEPN